MAHEIVYRVTKNPQTAPVLRQTDLFSNIHYSIIRFNEILTSFLRFFLSFYRMHFLTLSYLLYTRPNHRLLSCQPSGILLTDIIYYIYIDIFLKLENKFPEIKSISSQIARRNTASYEYAFMLTRLKRCKRLQKTYE